MFVASFWSRKLHLLPRLSKPSNLHVSDWIVFNWEAVTSISDSMVVSKASFLYWISVAHVCIDVISVLTSAISSFSVVWWANKFAKHKLAAHFHVLVQVNLFGKLRQQFEKNPLSKKNLHVKIGPFPHKHIFGGKLYGISRWGNIEMLATHCRAGDAEMFLIVLEVYGSVE